MRKRILIRGTRDASCVLRALCVSLSRQKHSVSLSLAPFRRNHRVSLSLLDDSACDFFICQQSDEGFSISIVGLVIYVGGLRPYLGGIVVSLSLLDDSASLSLSSTAHLDEESLHLSLHPVALLDEIKSKGKGMYFFLLCMNTSLLF